MFPCPGPAGVSARYPSTTCAQTSCARNTVIGSQPTRLTVAHEAEKYACAVLFIFRSQRFQVSRKCQSAYSPAVTCRFHLIVLCLFLFSVCLVSCMS